MADGLGKMVFTVPALAEEEDVFGLGEELAGEELVDLLTVDGGVEGEVEAVAFAYTSAP